MRTKYLVLAIIILLSMAILLLVCKGSKEVSKTEIEKIKEPETYNYRVDDRDKNIFYIFEYKNEPKINIKNAEIDGESCFVLIDTSKLNKILNILNLPPVENKEKIEDEYYYLKQGWIESSARVGRNRYTWKNYPLGELTVYVNIRQVGEYRKWKDEFYIQKIVLEKK